MSFLPTKPPRPDHDNKRFWQATAEGRIELPVCDECGLVIWYPRSHCPDCQTSNLTWTALSGKGTIYSYTIVRGGLGSRWKEHLPMVTAYVELDEGPRMITNIVDCDVDDVEIDMAVTAVFEDTGEDSALVRFRPS